MLSKAQTAFADSWGLALAAIAATGLVEEHTPDAAVRVAVRGLQTDALDLQSRCAELAGRYGRDVADEVRRRAIDRQDRAGELALPWFRAATGPAEAWTFLAMAEAGEVAMWLAAERLAAEERDHPLERLARDAAKIQRRHLETALDGTRTVAAAAPIAAAT